MKRPELIFPQELITSIDAMNTMSGGVAEPMVKSRDYSSFRQISIRIPSISLESVKIEINNNQLVIYYMTSLDIQGKLMQFPKSLYNKSIPYFVDADNISATEEGASLIVRLPFNKLSNGRHRDIKIKH
jgi:hypothetical protein